MIAANIKRLFNNIRVGNLDRVRDILEFGIDPNVRDKRGRPALIRAVRALIPDCGVVDALLEAGADPQATDGDGLTALDYARRRLVRLGDKPDPVRRSQSLDEHGNLVLSEEEQEFIEQMRREHPDSGEEFAEMYVQERRKVALRQFMPRREMRMIIDRLESLLPGAFQ